MELLISQVNKEDYIELSVSYESTDFNTFEDETSALIVYLYFTYDEGVSTETVNNQTVTHYNGLVGIYQSTSESGTVGGGDINEMSVKFVNDLLTISVSHD